MAEGVGPGRVGRVVRMVLVIGLAGLIGGFLHLRSVDPAGAKDEELADRIVLKAEQVPGFAVSDRVSEVAIRAGLRREAQDGKEEDDQVQEAVAAGQDRLERFSKCLGVESPGLVDKAYARAFGVDASDDRKTTAEVTVQLRQQAAGGGPIRFLMSSATLLSSPDAVQKSLREWESVGTEKLGSCFAETFSDLGTVTSTPLPAPVEGAVSIGYRAQITPAALPVSVTADVFVLLRDRAVAQLVAFGIGEPFPDAERQMLLELLGQHLRTEVSEEQP